MSEMNLSPILYPFYWIIPAILIAISTAYYLHTKYIRNYWKRKNVPFIPGNFFWGNVKQIFLLKECVAEEFSRFYFDERTKNEPFFGVHSFHKPMIVLKEPELIKRILIKDFNWFADRHSASNPHTDGLSYYNLFFLRNPMWKELRSRLTSLFTTVKMKNMFEHLMEIGQQLNNYIKMEIGEEKSVNMDIKELCAKYSTDTIASCAFGIQANSIKDPNSEFRKRGREVVNFTPYRGIEFLSFFFLPEIIRFCRFKIFHNSVANLLRSSIDMIMKQRESTGTVRNDLVDSLMAFKNEDKDKSSNNSNVVFKGDVIYAQAAVFYFAGFETASSTMTFALYEIAKQPTIQNRLRQYIKILLQKNGGKLTYESITNFEYLEMIIKETLRLYPPLPFLDRMCSLPKGENDYSLLPYSKYELPDGMPVLIPFFSIHRDPKYYPNPELFDPERFSPENIDKINPYIYMPFGTGPRNCIGSRFGMLQTKVGLVNILKDFYVLPCAKTLNPMRLKKKSVLIQADEEIYLDLVSDPLSID